MKKVFCIEEWLKEDERVRNGGFWGSLEQPWKLGLTSYIQEFDEEDEFKDYLMSIINDGGVIGRVFTKEVPDDYFCNNFDGSELRKEDNFDDVL